MAAFEFALYDAFSASAFGGSQAAVVMDAADIGPDQRRALAREIGMPATAFVERVDADNVSAQFFSTVMELPMCGHGTICLLTHLLESGRIEIEQARELELRLPRANATVALHRRDDGRHRVMLDIRPANFEPAPPHIGKLLSCLQLDSGALDADLPPETARGDFVHLVLPLRGLEPMQSIKPDFAAIVDFCHRNGIETIAAFCTEVIDAEADLHVRDFCPAVGVAESAAAGTTNAALAAYLQRHERIKTNGNPLRIVAEQGLELGRPSSIQSLVTLNRREIERLQVGGVATRVADGRVYL